MNKAIFLDRDGTINIEKDYLYKIEDFELIQGVETALKLLQQAGYILIVVTNQSGIGRGYYTEDDFHSLNDWMIGCFREKGINISKVYYCPHLPNAVIEQYKKECNCRKPKLGLFEQAIKDFDVDLANSYAIGDKIRDLEICLQTECRGYLVGSNEEPEIIDRVRKGLYPHVRLANNLYDCTLAILKNEQH